MPYPQLLWDLGQNQKLLLSRYVLSDSFATSRSVAHQAPLSMGFPRQEYQSGLPFPSLGDLPRPAIESIALQANTLPLSHLGSLHNKYLNINCYEPSQDKMHSTPLP